MRFTILAFLLLSAILSSCNDKQEVAVDPRLATDTLSIKMQPQLKQEIFLTSTAKEKIDSWKEFILLTDHVKALDTITLYNLRKQGSEWIKDAANAQKEVNDSIVNPAIQSRLNVLFSKTNTLVQEASKVKIDTALVNKEATELINAFQNLKLQINLKYQESIEELLEKYEIKADSLSVSRDSIRKAATTLSKLTPPQRQN
ncbi:hypothetical protein [Leeuwenhoekiella sp. NPDC079379]|uniref:hypothetical protein n=1 Tax=Leeuwenhoekiella sp. NPDC079379 TaxID=3364122 RepID=UPI0037C5C0EC